ncbi:MAG: hypothetical protein ACP5RX_00070 [Minisyncoccia bacterium]
MEKSKKIIILSVFTALSILGVLLYFYFYQNYLKATGILHVVLFPRSATLNINDKLYTSKTGVFNLQLPAKTYQIVISYPGYSLVQKTGEIKPRQTLDLGTVYLFPKVWSKEELVSDTTIDKFFPDQEFNRFVYFKKVAKNYDWYLYDRNTKDNIKFYQTTLLPQIFIFTPDRKQIIVELKDNDWQVVFLPKSLIEQPLNLNNELSSGLKQNNLQTKQNPIIQEVAPLLDTNSEVLIKTNQGLYQFNYLNKTVTQLVNTSTSPFIIDADNIYYIKNNGLFVKLNLSQLKETQLSLVSFYDSKDNLDTLIIKKASQRDLFLIIKSTGQAFLVNALDGTSILLGDNIIDGSFSPSNDNILLYLNDKKITKVGVSQNIKKEPDLISDSFPNYFLNDDFCLYSSSSSLNLYDFQNKEIISIGSDLKNSNFAYDPSLNYIFYLTPSGIKQISY